MSSSLPGFELQVGIVRIEAVVLAGNASQYEEAVRRYCLDPHRVAYGRNLETVTGIRPNVVYTYGTWYENPLTEIIKKILGNVQEVKL